MATEELYFVADGTGGHHSPNFGGHNRNVARWRGIRDQATGGDGNGQPRCCRLSQAAGASRIDQGRRQRPDQHNAA
jgi:hypothetical protein